MKKANLPFHQCSILSVNLIPTWKLLTSTTQDTVWSKENSEDSEVTQSSSQTRSTWEIFFTQVSWNTVSDLYIQGKEWINQEDGLDEET